MQPPQQVWYICGFVVMYVDIARTVHSDVKVGGSDLPVVKTIMKEGEYLEHVLSACPFPWKRSSCNGGKVKVGLAQSPLPQLLHIPFMLSDTM